MHRDAQSVCRFGQFKVETGIVYQYQCVGAECVKQMARVPQMSQQPGQVAQYLAESHHIHGVTVDLRFGPGRRGHAVTSEEAEYGLAVNTLYAANKSRGVQVAAHLAGYDHIFHLKLFCT